MQFNPGDGSGIVDDIDFLIQSDSNSYPIVDKCRNVNRAYDKAVSLILQADGRWEFDDQNATDLPIAVTDIINNQQDYSYDPTFLIIQRMEIKDSSGNWTSLLPFSQADIIKEGSSLSSFLNAPGTPRYYYKVANSIFLYPTPNYNMSGGLKAFYQRNISYFVPSDTTKSPGFNPQFHRYLSASAALDYAIAKNLPQGLPHGRVPNAITTMLATMESDLQIYYNRKAKDENIGLKTRRWKFT